MTCDETSRLPHPSRFFRSAGRTPKRRLGQNFLLDFDVFIKMLDAARVSERDCVLEVGTGLGRTTRLISERAGRVVAVEIDPFLARITAGTLAGVSNVTLLEIDALDSKSRLAEPVERALLDAAGVGLVPKLVANLPYSIGAPLIVTALESPLGFPVLSVMVQREVGRRITAAPATRDYGVMSVFAQLWADASELAVLPPGRFWPPPDVYSTALLLSRTTERRNSIRDYAVFSSLVRGILQTRRKMLKNSLERMFAPPHGGRRACRVRCPRGHEN